ncbi:hypothetical protein B0O80DRAFT_499426 [Mortierella sp. GBAus27b]|nr:hypothetical protein B0O80DRAFT_499426 [Mortierella sp. GBAus27b]
MTTEGQSQDILDDQHHQREHQQWSPTQTILAAPGTHRKPLIHLAGSEALVWDVDDVRELRQRHRIVGSLAGSLSRSPMQNIFQGLPLRLLPEEVFTLWSNGLVDFVDELQSYRQQPDTTTTVTSGPADTLGERSHNHVTVHTTSNSLPYYTPSLAHPHFTVSAENTQPSQASSKSTSSCTDIATEPRLLSQLRASARVQQKCVIFMHLWETQEYFLAPGMKFGGDYLLYRGDPLICHASLIATVEDADKALPLADLASSARLSSTVQKQRLFCSLSNPEQLHQLASTGAPSTVDTTSLNDSQATKPDVLKFVVEWAGF